MTTHTLSVLVSNRPGVLTRIAALFSRRGYNIESLAVGPTERPEVSRMTIAAQVEDEAALEQIVKQLNKLIEVRKVLELGANTVKREMVLVKVRADVNSRSQIIDVVSLFRGKAVDVSPESITIEATGAPDKLAALLEMLSPHGIQELVQSGQVALGRGARTMAETKSK
ncbi:acetolactate synthase small subunit [Tessaracoccus terricola]